MQWVAPVFLPVTYGQSVLLILIKPHFYILCKLFLLVYAHRRTAAAILFKHPIFVDYCFGLLTDRSVATINNNGLL